MACFTHDTRAASCLLCVRAYEDGNPLHVARRSNVAATCRRASAGWPNVEIHTYCVRGNFRTHPLSRNNGSTPVRFCIDSRKPCLRLVAVGRSIGERGDRTDTWCQDHEAVRSAPRPGEFTADR